MKKVFVLFFVFCLIFYVVSFAQETNSTVEVITPKAEKVKNSQAKESLIYYPVPYIPVLKDLRYDANNSAILKSGNVITGMLVFKGNYSAKSLIDFYKVQMKNNGWKEIGSFSSKITFIAYKRPGGSAFISVSEGYFSTELRIVVILTENK
ncbi:hypothetical protein [Thermodesulfobacterium hydrogeniphilum]|uniref:hypothetical protein n=1 Tax=Thermodesulfobacterium hydrogeniphilum TaxID=161156 RepID=UPI00056E84F5|nr:hypothetical protein [Thermodesulfobacterium hydrogeniphilum]